MVKDRPDCWEKQAGLSDAQKQLVYECLRDYGAPKARALLSREELMDGIAIPGKTALYAFYDRYSAEVSEDRLRRAYLVQASINNSTSKMEDISETMIKGIGFLAVEAIASGDVQAISALVKQYNGLISTLQAKQEQALSEARFELIKSDKYQAGLAALAEQIRGNSAAQAAFAEFKAVIEGEK